MNPCLAMRRLVCGNDILCVLHLVGLAIALELCGLNAVASAQSFPTKPLRLIIPVAPGGGTDFIGRLIAIKLAEPLGHQIIIAGIKSE